MIMDNLHPGVRLVTVLSFLTAVIASNIWLIVFAIIFLIGMRLPNGLHINGLVWPFFIGLFVILIHTFFNSDSINILEISVSSIRIGLIISLILVSAMLYGQDFTAKEWLVVFSFFSNRKILIIASFLAQMTRAITTAYENILIVSREVRLRPRLYGFRSRMRALPGLSLTFFLEMLRYIEIYSDTWNLRFGSPYLALNTFARPLTRVDKISLVGALSFVFACFIL